MTNTSNSHGELRHSGIFGKSLEEVMRRKDHDREVIPIIVKKCLKFLSQEDRLKQQGILRIPGPESEVYEYRKRLDLGEYVTFDANTSPFTVASLLKSYLCQLPKSVVELKETILALMKNTQYFALTEKMALAVDTIPQSLIQQRDQQQQILITQIKNIIASMSPHSQQLLNELFYFLAKVASYRQDNKMSSSNIGIVFGPVLFLEGSNDRSLNGSVTHRDSSASTPTKKTSQKPGTPPGPSSHLDSDDLESDLEAHKKLNADSAIQNYVAELRFYNMCTTFLIDNYDSIFQEDEVTYPKDTDNNDDDESRRNSYKISVRDRIAGTWKYRINALSLDGDTLETPLTKPSDIHKICKFCCHLVELDLSNNAIVNKDIPDSISRLTRLEKVSFARNKLTKMPKLAQCHNLREINLRMNEIKKWPYKQLSKLKNLQTLDLAWNEISKLRSATKRGKLRHKLERNSSNNNNNSHGDVLPPSLTHLNLAFNHLTAFPNYKYLVHLRYLDLSCNAIRSIPKDITKLSMIATLKLSDCGFSGFPMHMLQLSSLTELDLSKNNITNLPIEIGKLSKLVSLSLEGCSLEGSAYPLVQLTQLRVLNLQRNKITEVPDEFFMTMSRLEELYLRDNLLSQLSVTVCLMTSLRVLDIRKNKITTMDAFDTPCSIIMGQQQGAPPGLAKSGKNPSVFVHLPGQANHQEKTGAFSCFTSLLSNSSSRADTDKMNYVQHKQLYMNLAATTSGSPSHAQQLLSSSSSSSSSSNNNSPLASRENAPTQTHAPILQPHTSSDINNNAKVPVLSLEKLAPQIKTAATTTIATAATTTMTTAMTTTSATSAPQPESAEELGTIHASGFSALKNLEIFEASGNPITVIPDLSNMRKLHTLDLSDLHLTAVPTGIGLAINLTKVMLGGNRRIQVLPDEFYSLNQLQEADLRGMSLRSVSPLIAQLTSLKTLNLDGNLIETLPIEITTLTSLRTLSMNNNSDPSLMDPEVAAWLQKQKDSGLLTVHHSWERPDKVMANLWIGSASAAGCRHTLEKLGITHVVSIIKNFVPPHGDAFKYLVIPINDVPESDIKSYFAQTNAFIDEGREAGGCIVHCEKGASRSAAVVTAYLMYSRGFNLKTAFNLLQRARPCVNPNRGFQKQLTEYNQMLFGSKSLDGSGRGSGIVSDSNNNNNHENTSNNNNNDKNGSTTTITTVATSNNEQRH